jgi:hypothetical protein
MHNDGFIFDVKNQKYERHTRMLLPRAKHCSCLFTDPKEPANKLVLVAGGITETTKVDSLQKRKTQSLADTDLIEYFNFRTWKWDLFNARLTIARHSAAAVEVNGSIYVVGGHTVALPDQYINSIERYNTKANASCFEILDVKYM